MIRYIKATYDKTKYLLWGSFWLSLSQAFSAFRLLATSILIARTLGPTAFGEYTYILAIFYVTNIFGAPGFSIALFRSVSKGFHGSLREITERVFFYSLCGSVFLLGFSLYAWKYNSLPQGVIFSLLALVFPFFSVGINCIYYLSGAQKFRERMWYEGVLNFTTLSMILGTFSITHSLFWLIVATIIPPHSYKLMLSLKTH